MTFIKGISPHKETHDGAHVDTRWCELWSIVGWGWRGWRSQLIVSFLDGKERYLD